MTKDEFKERIKGLAFGVIRDRKKAEIASVEYDELTKFPELKKAIISLLTTDFDPFLSSIDWVAPRPTTFRINLRNDQNFYLIWMGRSWIAQIEGKKYYLLNLPEEERAVEAIARILRYGSPESKETAVGVDSGVSDDASVDDTTEIDDTTDVEIDV
jgi:hypothetical protein|tara:strand:- start:514 stop:984 length:471 start_codon:yes stop_codon:yes gene_type:complete